MLPLWIIDLTQDADRRKIFTDLLGQVKGVLTYEDGVLKEPNATHDFLESYEDNEKSRECIWFYSHIKNPFESEKDLNAPFAADMATGVEEEVEYHRQIANKLYKDFQEVVVKEGQKFIELLRRTSGHAYSVINICVVGDSTEEFSRLVFPSVAVMLQKEKGRILPHHVHQGMSILGAFYIPSDVNTFEVSIRNKIHKTLEEIDVQHNISTVRGYDRMLYYQNVQNRAENSYPLLNHEAEAQYLLQCLEHLYYACSEVHPLMNGVTLLMVSEVSLEQVKCSAQRLGGKTMGMVWMPIPSRLSLQGCGMTMATLNMPVKRLAFGLLRNRTNVNPIFCLCIAASKVLN